MSFRARAEKIDADYFIPRPADEPDLDSFHAATRFLQDLSRGGTLLLSSSVAGYLFFKSGQLINLSFKWMVFVLIGAFMVALVGVFPGVQETRCMIAFSKKSSYGPQPTLQGDILVFASMFAALVMILITKRLIAAYGSLQVTAAMITMGTIILLIWIEATHPLRFHFSPRIWLAVIAQGVLATTAAYLFWNWGLARVPAARAGVFLNLEPLVGTLLGMVILQERLGALGSVGGVLILVSAAYFSRRPQ